MLPPHNLNTTHLRLAQGSLESRRCYVASSNPTPLGRKPAHKGSHNCLGLGVSSLHLAWHQAHPVGRTLTNNASRVTMVSANPCLIAFLPAHHRELHKSPPIVLLIFGRLQDNSGTSILVMYDSGNTHLDAWGPSLSRCPCESREKAIDLAPAQAPSRG